MEFAKQGAKVGIDDVNEEAQETVKKIEDMSGETLFTKTDVSSVEEVKHLIDTTVKTLGHLDHTFNNAGILNDANRFGAVSVEEFDQVMNIDLKGVFLAMKYQLNQMEENGGGTIVNTSSEAGLIADPEMPLYIATKHGVVGLTQSAGFDYVKENIRVNTVAPGLVETATRKYRLLKSTFCFSIIGCSLILAF